MSRALWPIGEAAQADYEQLRAAASAGVPALGAVAAVFERQGLWGLIARPAAGSLHLAGVVGAARAPWSPHADARVLALADGFQIIVAASAATITTEEKTG